MIRTLAIIAVTGLIISMICFSIAIALAGRSIAQGHGGWGWISQFSDAVEDGGPIIDLDTSGPQSERELAWDGDDKLEIHIPAIVTYTQGADATVKVSGPRSVIDRIEVENGSIGLPGVRTSNVRGERHIQIDIVAPNVERFEFNGAQKVTIREFDQDDLRIQVNGAADVDASGRARHMDLQANGASNIDVGDLEVADAEIQVNGAGRVRAAPTNDADVEINGVGQIDLLGRPAHLTQSRHGFGHIEVHERSDSRTDKGDETSANP